MKVLSLGIDPYLLKGFKVDCAKNVDDVHSLVSIGTYGYMAVAAHARDLSPNLFRWWGSDLPLVLLTDRKEGSFRAEMLNKGADVCLSMPVDIDELCASIMSAVRRSNGRASNTVAFDGFVMDLGDRILYRDNMVVDLTHAEFALLEVLAINQGRVVSKGAILDHMYHGDVYVEDQIVGVIVCRLRKIIGMGSIQTYRERGYKLVKEGV